MGRASRGISIAALSVAALVAAAAPAAADYTAVDSDPVGVAEGTIGFTSVQCPAGAAISGGTYNAAPLSEMLWLNSSLPGGPEGHASWTVRVENVFDGIATTSDIYAWAVCDDQGSENYRYRKEIGAPIRSQRQTKIVVACGPSAAVVGGGASSPAEGVYLSTSTPADTKDKDKRPDAWKVVLDASDNDGPPGEANAYAVCDTERRASDFRYPVATDEVADGEQLSVVATCTPFEGRVGGGVRSKSKLAHELRINSTDPTGDTGWDGIVDNADTADDKARTIEATAICLKAD